MISGDYYVILITARSTKYMKATMAKIHKELNWLPNEYYFNEHQESPPAAKLKILKNFILNRFDKSDMIALESNIETRKMYKQNGIFAVRYEPSWTEIPTIPNNQ